MYNAIIIGDQSSDCDINAIFTKYHKLIDNLKAIRFRFYSGIGDIGRYGPILGLNVFGHVRDGCDLV
jgi:hypothetical protein